jgi:signal transduction histidine kinase
MADKKILFIIPKNKKFDSLKELAKSIDVPVEVKNDELKGYECLKKGNYDLVISSMFAGKLNGYELVSKLKKDKINCGVILIMGDTKEKIRKELKNNGVFSFVKKAECADELSQQINNFFRKKKSLPPDDKAVLERKKFALENTIFELEQKLVEKTNELKYIKEKSEEIYDEFQVTKERLKKKKKYIISSERMISLGQMTASIIHEINNPLTVITSIAGLLSMECKSEKVAKYNDTLSTHIDNLRHYIHTVISFANPTKNAKYESIDANIAIEDLLVFYGYELKKKEISLVTKFSPNLPKINIPKVKLQQIILNILKNASYAAKKSDPSITVTTKAIKGHVAIKIKDNGMGIKKAELEEIFKPFFTTKGREEGSGLGLYICNDIIKSYGGTIEIDSAYKKGTTVTIKLPVPQK